MDLEEFINGVERLIVRILLWIIIIPKTLFKIFMEPDWVVGYIDKEISETEDAQFDDYMSPILLFLICSLVLFLIASETEGLGSAWEKAQSATGFLGGIGFLSLPLIFAFIIEIVKHKKIVRSSLIRSLNIQCYFFSPLTLSIFSVTIIGILLPESVWIFLSALIISLGTIIWFILVEIKLIKHEIGGGILKSISILTGSTIFIIAVGGLIWFALFGESSGEQDNYGEGGEEEIALTLPSDGSFSILISGFYGSFGDYTLRIKDENSVALNLESQEETLLPNDDVVFSELINGSRDEWFITGNQGDVFDIVAMPENEKLDLVLELFDTNGTLLFWADSNAENGYEEIFEFELPASGEYLIMVSGYEDTAGEYYLYSINYNLSTSSASSANRSDGIQYNETVLGSLSESDEDNRWVFNGVKGDMITIHVVPETNFDVVFDVVDKNGNSIHNPSDSNKFIKTILGTVYIILVGLAVFLGLRSLWKNRKSESKYEDEAIEDEALLV